MIADDTDQKEPLMWAHGEQGSNKKNDGMCDLPFREESTFLADAEQLSACTIMLSAQIGRHLLPVSKAREACRQSIPFLFLSRNDAASAFCAFGLPGPEVSHLSESCIQ